MIETKDKKECGDCGTLTTWRIDGLPFCPACASQRLKGGAMQCKTCKISCRPIGTTLNGTLLLACTGCGQVYADIPGITVSRRGAEAAHRAHNPEVGRSSRPAATRKQHKKKEVSSETKSTRTQRGSSQHRRQNSTPTLAPGRLSPDLDRPKRTGRRNDGIRDNHTAKRILARGAPANNPERGKQHATRHPGKKPPESRTTKSGTAKIERNRTTGKKARNVHIGR